MQILVKNSLKYGIIAGLLTCALLAGLFYMGQHPFLVPPFFDIRLVVFGIFIFFTLKEFRDHYQQGILYFWQGLIASFTFVACFAVITSVFVWIFATMVPDFVKVYVDVSTRNFKALGQEVIEKMGKDFYDRNLKLLPSTDGLDLALLYSWQSFMIGVFISIILSVTLRRQPKL